jgi:hypothetical protein
VRSVATMGRAAHKVHPNIVSSEVVNGPMTVLVHDHGTSGVCDRRAREHHSDAFAGGVKRHGIAWLAVKSKLAAFIACSHLLQPRFSGGFK